MKAILCDIRVCSLKYVSISSSVHVSARTSVAIINISADYAELLIILINVSRVISNKDMTHLAVSLIKCIIDLAPADFNLFIFVKDVCLVVSSLQLYRSRAEVLKLGVFTPRGGKYTFSRF